MSIINLLVGSASLLGKHPTTKIITQIAKIMMVNVLPVDLSFPLME